MVGLNFLDVPPSLTLMLGVNLMMSALYRQLFLHEIRGLEVSNFVTSYFIMNFHSVLG